MLLVSTRSHSHLFGRRCENVKLRIRKELAQQLSFARSSSLFAVASSNSCILAYIRRIGERVKVEMPQSDHLRQPKCFGPLRSTFMRSRVDRKPLVSEDAIDRGGAQYRWCCDLYVECLPFQSVQKLDSCIIYLVYMYMQAKPETKLDTWFMCRFLYEWTSYKFYGKDSF